MSSSKTKHDKETNPELWVDLFEEEENLNDEALYYT